MRRVRHKTTLTVERTVELFEHVVKRVGKLFDLVAWPTEPDAFVQAMLRTCRRGNSLGGRGELADRPKRAFGDEPAEAERSDADDAERYTATGQERIEGLLFKLLLLSGDLDGRLLRGDETTVRELDHRLAASCVEADLAGHDEALPAGRRRTHALLDEHVRHAEKDDARHEEKAAVQQGQADPDRRPLHRIRYPTPGLVSMIGGSPSLRRSFIMVTRMTLVNGSVFSSHTRSKSCSAETTAPSARSSSARTANSLRDSRTD